jgi:hypothetical protein
MRKTICDRCKGDKEVFYQLTIRVPFSQDTLIKKYDLCEDCKTGLVDGYLKQQK